MTMESSSAGPQVGLATQARYTSLYTELMGVVRDSGLLRRRYGYYWSRIGLATVGFAGIWVAFFLLGHSWWQLLPAAALGVLCTQFGFLAHDGAHRQIFRSAAWNTWTARVLAGVFAGLSYGWWRTKHTGTMRHRTRKAMTRTSPPARSRSPRTWSRAGAV